MLHAFAHRVVHPLLMTALLLAWTLMMGCSSTPSSADLSPDVVPPELNLKVYRHLEGGRHTYFTLSPAGELAFAGGRPAVLRTASPVTTLTPAQRQELWALIVNHKLLDVKGQAFKTGKQVTYEVEIKTRKGFGGKSFRVIEDAVPPGVKLLHDKLFEYQAQVRYQHVLPETIRQEDQVVR